MGAGILFDVSLKKVYRFTASKESGFAILIGPHGFLLTEYGGNGRKNIAGMLHEMCKWMSISGESQNVARTTKEDVGQRKRQ